ncbi:unnamed protein product [Brassicogethes aeneus]|uniref:MADF domain-containing protein n=1 Tax=Brassicogethes aeneus TaxID=1431903 RepID=A0A9P0FLN1_BRAAE|nr:unnamed protein product [Brassicogethes aeneus]
MPDERNKKQWTTEEVSNLIESYRAHTNLWNPKNTEYKNRIKKMDSLKEIAKLFNTNFNEVERKIKNLITQYQRERRNYKNMKKSGAGQIFKPKWFGYNSMLFLNDKNKPRRGVEAGGDYYDADDDSSDEETGDLELQMESSNSLTEEPDSDQTMAEGNNTLGTENQEELPSTSKNNNNNFPEVVKVSVKKNKVIPPAAENNLQHPFATPKVSHQKKKLKTGNDTSESQSSEIFEMMKSMYKKKDETAKRDEFDVFGEMVAHNLRNLKSEYSKISLQQRITSLLYEARISCNFPQNSMQYFTTPLPSPSPPSPYARTSSSASSYGSVLQSHQQYQTVNPTSYNNNMENPTILESQPQYQTLSPTSFNDDLENTSILERAFTSAINDNSQNKQ